jgi:hypothetical protein
MTEMFDPKPGIYKGRVVKGTEEYGESPNGNPELYLQIEIPELDNRRFTTVLYFSGDAAPYSVPRLRACGWEGNDISNLEGIDKNEIAIDIGYPIDPGDGKPKRKVQISTGGGVFGTKKPIDRQTFAAKVAAITGMAIGGGGGAAAPKPKF